MVYLNSDVIIYLKLFVTWLYFTLRSRDVHDNQQSRGRKVKKSSPIMLRSRIPFHKLLTVHEFKWISYNVLHCNAFYVPISESLIIVQQYRRIQMYINRGMTRTLVDDNQQWDGPFAGRGWTSLASRRQHGTTRFSLSGPPTPADNE